MHVTYRSIRRTSETEMRFVAQKDSQIPKQYVNNYFWSEASIEERIAFYDQKLSESDFFDVAVLSESEDKVIGFHAVKKFALDPDEFGGAIITLWVDPAHRATGIGHELKSRAEKWARANGRRELRTNVSAANTRMLEINKKNGFLVSEYAMVKKL